jgi:hypothetical protein
VVEAFVAVGNPSQPTSYFEFEINPLAARFSALVDSPNLSREEMRVETFDCPGFTARVLVRERIWSALLALPLEALACRPVTALRANFFRVAGSRASSRRSTRRWPTRPTSTGRAPSGSSPSADRDDRFQGGRIRAC